MQRWAQHQLKLAILLSSLLPASPQLQLLLSCSWLVFHFRPRFFGVVKTEFLGWWRFTVTAGELPWWEESHSLPCFSGQIFNGISFAGWPSKFVIKTLKTMVDFTAWVGIPLSVPITHMCVHCRTLLLLRHLITAIWWPPLNAAGWTLDSSCSWAFELHAPRNGHFHTALLLL